MLFAANLFWGSVSLTPGAVADRAADAIDRVLRQAGVDADLVVGVGLSMPGNATALQVIPLPQLSSTPTDLISDPVNTYLYDRNIAGAPVCAVNATLDDQTLAASGDALSTEWSKVRSRPNLVNCFDAERRSGCSDF